VGPARSDVPSASAFLAAGARVVATTRHAVDGESHERLSIEAVDLVDEESMLGLAALVRERYGRCDVLACCAGGFEAGVNVAAAPLALWRRLLDLNATSCFLACRAFLPLMLESAAGVDRARRREGRPPPVFPGASPTASLQGRP